MHPNDKEQLILIARELGERIQGTKTTDSPKAANSVSTWIDILADIIKRITR